MKLHKCGISEFAEITKDRPIVCFGDSQIINDMCTNYYQYKLWKRIIAVADNNERKHGAIFRAKWNYINIISVNKLIEMYMSDKSIALLITVGHIKCIEIVKQLNEISELNDIDCFIYTLFPYCETISPVPEEVLHLKSIQPLIPPVIHYIWLGEKTIPQEHLEWMSSWKKYCPSFETTLWNEDNYDVYKNKYMAEAYKCGKFSFVSDYMRLDIISRYGGIYLDTDVELIKSLNDLLYYNAYFGLGQHAAINTGHGFGAAPGNKLVKEMADEYEDVAFIKNDGSYNLLCCDTYQGEVLRRHGFTGGNKFSVVQDAVIFPVEFFSPMSTGFGIMQVTENCYSIHHFASTHFEPHIKEKRKENQNKMESLLLSQ